VIIGGEERPDLGTYGDYQEEMNMVNRAFIEVMLEGDYEGRVFSFPIPTYNITSDFPWDSENARLLWSLLLNMAFLIFRTSFPVP
jgi:ribonucleoside-triphosphate reductase